MKKDQNLRCRQRLWKSFNTFGMNDIESNKEGKICRTMSGDDNK